MKVPCEPKIASNKATWIEKFTVASLDPASCEAKTVLDHKTPSAPQLRLYSEAKVKTPCAYSDATVSPLASTTLMGNAQPV